MSLGTEVGLTPGHIVLDGNPALPRPERAQQPPPTFRPMSIVAKRSPVSELLSFCFLHDTAVVGKIYYTTCRRSFNEGFFKIRI